MQRNIQKEKFHHKSLLNLFITQNTKNLISGQEVEMENSLE